MDKRRVGAVFVMIGAVLLISALLLFLYNENEAQQAGEAADTALSAVQDAIEAYSSTEAEKVEKSPVSTEPAEEITPEPTELTVVNIDGYNYIGYLSIPYFDLELPIMDDWSEERLHIAPCLQFGSPLTNDAVIAGHNYKQHFLPLHDVEPGEYLTFTDMTGCVIEYAVVEVVILDPTNVDAVENSGHDLTLYTCTVGGQSRVVVFCDRLEEWNEQIAESD